MKNSKSKSSLFLMELIVSIFFFSLASAVCIQLFVKAHLLGTMTTEQNNCALWSQNIAEAFYGTHQAALDAANTSSTTENDGDTSSLYSDLLPLAYEDSEKIILYFDKDWNTQTVFDDTTAYQATALLNTDDTYRYCTISIQKIQTDSVSSDSDGSDSSPALYELSVKDYISEGSVASHE